MHCHIATVGVKPELIRDVISMVGGIDRVYLLYTTDTEECANTVIESSSKTIEFIKIKVDEYDFLGIIEEVYNIKNSVSQELKNASPEIKKKMRNMHYSVNITGGRKTMSAAVAVGAYYLCADIIYKKENADNSLPIEDSLVKITGLHLIDDSKFSQKNKKNMKEIVRYLYINRDKDITSAKISEDLGLTPQTVSYQINKVLLPNNLIRIDQPFKADGSENHRSKIITLTVSGSIYAKNNCKDE